ncbi:VOC family protein [Archangium violaceum]|uniref:VOC family protein n=1 Tax=Archangium violaceum TaxID=83451 RepID=UPI0019508B28|nr:VOC family protein [Archangium violaceum]QRN95885.1 VOC family protein [Archangium violaceum]
MLKMATVACAAALVTLPVLAAEPTPAPAASPPLAATGAFNALYVADAPRLADWYVKTLGFTVVKQGTISAPRVSAFALLRKEDTILEILQVRTPPTPGPHDQLKLQDFQLGVAKIGFYVADVAGWEKTLADRGAVFNHKLVTSPDLGLKTFAVRDPEGNTIQFFGK